MSASTVYDVWTHEPSGWSYVGRGTLAWLGTRALASGVHYLSRQPSGTQTTTSSTPLSTGRGVYDVWTYDGAAWQYVARSTLMWFGSQRDLQTGMIYALKVQA